MALPSLFATPSVDVFAKPSLLRSDEGTSLFKLSDPLGTGRRFGILGGPNVGAETNVDDGEEQDPREGLSDTRIRARRPMRGIQIKEDTYCSLRIVSQRGKKILQVDAAGNEDKNGDGPNLGRSFINTNFIAQTINEERVEKAQIIETFGDPFVFFFGERPRFINVSGYLLNTVDFNWRAEWWENYERNLRGTRLVQQKAKVYLTWDDVVVEGFILNASAQDMAMEPYRIPFSFSIFLTRYFNVGIRGQIPTGTMNPIERLKKTAESQINAREGSFFNKIFSPVNQDRVNLVIGGALTIADNPVRAALAIVQSAAAPAVRAGVGAIENLTKTDQEKAALRRLKGIDIPGRSGNKFGPLKDNFDEFLNTELDRLDVPTLRTRGLDSNNFLQKMINFVPGLNNPRTLGRLLNTMKKNHNSVKAVSSATAILGGTGLAPASSFTSPVESSPFLAGNVLRRP